MRRKGSRFATRYALRQAPIGCIAVVSGPDGVIEITSNPDDATIIRRFAGIYPEAREGSDEIIDVALTQLKDYFAGTRWEFDLSLDWRDLSPFAVDVLRALQKVPYGATIGYGELAALAGHRGAARAVGRVMAGNPFPVVIPCHRVLGSNGAMTGYSGGKGIATKEWLLAFEGGKSV